MIKLKLIIRKFLLKLTYPYFSYIVLPILCKNNLYVSRSYIDKTLLDTLTYLKGYNSFNVSSTGVLILFYDKSVIKIPLGDISKKSLSKNFDNYKMLKKTNLYKLVDYRLDKIEYYYKMDKLFPFKNNKKELELLIQGLEKESKEVYLKDVYYKLFTNLHYLEKICDNKFVFNKNIQINSSIMHGDLTEYNIMLNQFDSIILIDLDRFTFNGIKGLDMFHYKTDKESKEQGISFFEYIDNNLNKENLLISTIYILYRVSQEFQKNIHLNQSYYQRLNNIWRKIEEFN